jgi:hypothetical protein
MSSSLLSSGSLRRRPAALHFCLAHLKPPGGGAKLVLQAACLDKLGKMLADAQRRKPSWAVVTREERHKFPYGRQAAVGPGAGSGAGCACLDLGLARNDACGVDPPNAVLVR